MELNADCSYEEQAVLAKVGQKPIEQGTAEDLVLSYHEQGNLKLGLVTRTFQNQATYTKGNPTFH